MDRALHPHRLLVEQRELLVADLDPEEDVEEAVGAPEAPVLVELDVLEHALRRPAGLTVGIGIHGAGVLFVADQGNYRISRFTTGGRPLSPIGSFGLGPGELVHPYGVTLDAAGRVYVTDAIKGSVIVFTARGQLLGEFGSLGSGPGELRKPTGIAVDRGNVILVSDYCNKRVQMFSPTGTPLGTFGEGTLEGPTGIVADGQGAVWVSDVHRVVVFADVATLREPRESVAQRAARRAGGAAADSRARASRRLAGNTLPEVCDGPVH